MTENNQHKTEIPEGALHKSVVREMYNMKSSHFTRLLNVRLFEELEKVGYKKADKYLFPIVFQKLVELIGHPDNWANVQDHI